MNSYTPRNLESVIILTSTLENIEISLKSTTFMNPLNTIYLFCILFREQEEYCIKLDNHITLKYVDSKLDILYKSTLLCSVNSTIDFKKIINAFSSIVLMDLMKYNFKGIRLKSTIISFFNDLIQCFFNQKIQLYLFIKNVSELFKQNCGPTNIVGTTSKSESSISQLIGKFAKNGLEISDFCPFYYIFCQKLIIFMHATDSIEVMDTFLKSYSLT